MTPEESAACKKLKEQYKRIYENLDDLVKACVNDPILKEKVGDALDQFRDGRSGRPLEVAGLFPDKGCPPDFSFRIKSAPSLAFFQ